MTKKKVSPGKRIPKNMQPTLERKYFEQCKKFSYKMITFQPCKALKFAVSAIMLLALTCFTLYDGLYFHHIELDTKAEHFSNEYYEQTELPERRLILLQVDSLGSDLVQMSKDDFVSNDTTLLTLFYQMALEQPDRAILLPLQTSSPYNFYTGSAIQTVLTGSPISSLG